MEEEYAYLTEKSSPRVDKFDKMPIFGYTGVDKYTYSQSL